MLTALGEKIFIDRYALKEHDNFGIGDKVFANGQLGRVLSVSNDTISIKLESGEQISCEKSNVAKPIETPERMFKRVAVAVAKAEENRGKWRKEFFHLLRDFKFIPGGRILSAAGTATKNLTYYNCFVLPSPKDSREGIINTLQQMVNVMSRGGGVGINISSLRPKDSHVRGVSGRSSGAVSWGALYSFVTGLICQGGSRRGALCLVLNDWHPDVLSFVSAKRKEGDIRNANISVAISDDFMEAVEQDKDWQLVFPDTRHSEYDALWDGDLQAWTNAVRPVVKQKTIKAKELWEAIVDNAWANGEPGIWFIDRANKMSNSHYLGRLNCTNPCFEEPLPSWGVCCLGSLNLPAFISNSGTLVWDALERAIRVAVRFLDDVIDVTPYFHKKVEKRQKDERRIGLGTMGLAEVLIRLGLRYGSDESLSFIDKLYDFIAKTAYLASVELAKEKGKFPAFNELFLSSGFMINMPSEVREAVLEHGIRNMTILTQAPTGATATMVGTSTGIEPFFDWQYVRKSQIGVDDEYVKVYAEWKEANPDSPLPDYFVTTKDITVDEHVAVQSTIQRWVDASISKTVNLPNEATRDDASNVFKKLYESGCKGGTVYRDGSRNEQVLQSKPEAGSGKSEGKDSRLPISIKELPYKRQGSTVSVKTPSGTAHITMNHDDSGQPFEVFVEIGKAGSSIKAMAEAIGRLISLIFRLEPIPQLERGQEIIEQLSGIGGAHSIGFGKNKVLSLPDAISKALAEHYELQLNLDAASYKNNLSAGVLTAQAGDICPVCGQSSYIREEGCSHCLSCGHSEC